MQKTKARTAIVPPCELRFVDGRKYRAGDEYPLPAVKSKSKPTTGGDT